MNLKKKRNYPILSMKIHGEKQNEQSKDLWGSYRRSNMRGIGILEGEENEVDLKKYSKT